MRKRLKSYQDDLSFIVRRVICLGKRCVRKKKKSIEKKNSVLLFGFLM